MQAPTLELKPEIVSPPILTADLGAFALQ